VKCDE
jgi:hypothetical protein